MKKFILLVIFCMVVGLYGENSSSFLGTNNASAYSFSGNINSDDQLKIYTHIWGQVRSPGFYIVPDDTDLLSLLSLAGGPTEDAKLTKVRIVRPIEDGEKVIMVNVQEYLETGKEELIPVLKPGDSVIVSGTIFYSFKKTADFLSKIAIVLSIYATINNLNN